MDDEFEGFLVAGKLSNVRSWYKKLEPHVQTHRDHLTTWIGFDKAFAPWQWAHLPRHQIIEKNTCPAWVCRPTCVWVDISSGDNIRSDTIYRDSERLIQRLVEWTADEEVL